MAPDGAAAYDLSVYGPNGFYRHYRGGALELAATNLVSGVVYNVSANSVTLMVSNTGTQPATLNVETVYSGAVTSHVIQSGAQFKTSVSLGHYGGWYNLILTVESDLTFQQEIAGHMETGRASTDRSGDLVGPAK